MVISILYDSIYGTNDSNLKYESYQPHGWFFKNCQSLLSIEFYGEWQLFVTHHRTQYLTFIFKIWVRGDFSLELWQTPACLHNSHDSYSLGHHHKWIFMQYAVIHVLKSGLCLATLTTMQGAAGVRACNFINLKPVGIIEPLLKIVTCTVQLCITRCSIFSNSPIILTRLWASIGVTHSFSSCLFFCAPATMLLSRS